MSNLYPKGMDLAEEDKRTFLSKIKLFAEVGRIYWKSSVEMSLLIYLFHSCL